MPKTATQVAPRLIRIVVVEPQALVRASLREIVSEEPVAAKPTTRTLEAPPITTYTGPTIGVSSMARAPTVGYYWSLEPETDTH